MFQSITQLSSLKAEFKSRALPFEERKKQAAENFQSMLVHEITTNPLKTNVFKNTAKIFIKRVQESINNASELIWFENGKVTEEHFGKIDNDFFERLKKNQMNNMNIICFHRRSFLKDAKSCVPFAKTNYTGTAASLLKEIDQIPINFKTPELQQLQFHILEDFVRSGTVISLFDCSPFISDLEKLAPILGLKIKYLHHPKSTWNRDYYYKGLDRLGNIVTYVTPGFRESNGLKYIAEKKDRDIFKNTLMEENVKEYSLHKGLSSFKSDFTKTPRVFHIDERDHIFNQLKQEPQFQHLLKHKSTAVEGGNLLTAINNMGRLKFIIGESAVEHSCYFQDLLTAQNTEKESDEFYLQNKTPGALASQKGFQKWFESYNKVLKNPEKSSQMAQDRIVEKYRIGHELNAASQVPFEPDFKKNLIVVPQWTYHIDLQMAYIGNGKLLIHSFEHALQFLKENESSIVSELETIFEKQVDNAHRIALRIYRQMIQLNTDFSAEFEQSIVNETSRKLEKHGFTAHKCCGNLFYIGLKNGVPLGLLGDFMNGISGHSNTIGSDYFLTAHSALSCFETYFEKMTHELGLKCYFLNTMLSGQTEPDRLLTTHYIDSTQGSLRCQTNTNLGITPEKIMESIEHAVA